MTLGQMLTEYEGRHVRRMSKAALRRTQRYSYLMSKAREAMSRRGLTGALVRQDAFFYAEVILSERALAWDALAGGDGEAALEHLTEARHFARKHPEAAKLAYMLLCK